MAGRQVSRRGKSVRFDLAGSGRRKRQYGCRGIVPSGTPECFTTDAADYYYGTQQHQLDPDRTYQLKLETSAFKATGLRAQHKFQATEQLTVAIGGSLLQAKGLQDGTLVGQATTDSSGKDQSYHAVVDYQYDQDRLLDRPDVLAPQGIGYALDARLDWQATERLGVNLVVKDILGEIHWNDVPYTSATLTSDVKTVGSDGFIKVLPSVSGKEGYLDSFRQTLHPKVDAQAKYQFDRNGKSISALVKHVPEKTMWGIGGELPVANRQLSVSLFPEENFLNIGYSGKRSELSIGMDSFDPGSANTVWVSFGLH